MGSLELQQCGLLFSEGTLGSGAWSQQWLDQAEQPGKHCEGGWLEPKSPLPPAAEAKCLALEGVYRCQWWCAWASCTLALCSEEHSNHGAWSERGYCGAAAQIPAVPSTLWKC